MGVQILRTPGGADFSWKLWRNLWTYPRALSVKNGAKDGQSSCDTAGSGGGQNFLVKYAMYLWVILEMAESRAVFQS